MRRGPFADAVHISTDGVNLVWRRGSPEARYSGRFIPWRVVRDADPNAYPPQLRLTNGRTVFISREYHAELTAAIADAGVAIQARPDPWAHLLEPFLDTEYDEVSRQRCESHLHSWGFTDEEIRRIRRRVQARMWVLTALTWEWGSYGHSDVVLATSFAPGFLYRRFRAWADEIAARSVSAIPHERP